MNGQEPNEVQDEPTGNDYDAVDPDDVVAEFDTDLDQSSKRRWVRVIGEFISSQIEPVRVVGSEGIETVDPMTSIEFHTQVVDARRRALTAAYDRLARIFESDKGE